MPKNKAMRERYGQTPWDDFDTDEWRAAMVEAHEICKPRIMKTPMVVIQRLESVEKAYRPKTSQTGTRDQEVTDNACTGG